MLLKETIDKSKNLFHKTLRNLKSFFGGYQKLPKSLSFNPFSSGCGKLKNCKADQYYTDFYNEWESHLDKISKRASNATMASKDVMMEENGFSESIVFPKQSPVKTKQDAGLKEKKKIGSSHLGRAKESNAQNMVNSGGFALAKKMKELEMMDAGDVEQVLDIEEALHYYSRLKSPVYVDIVDKFFTDMYSESSIPPAPVSINNSKRRFGSFRL